MINNLNTPIHSVSKLEVWRAIRSYIFESMDKNLMSSERGDEILNFVQSSIVDIETPEESIDYCDTIIMKFPELSKVKIKFEKQYAKELDKSISKVLDYLMQNLKKQINLWN